MLKKHMLTVPGPLLIVIAAVLWAFDGVVRRSLFTLPPITIVFYEHLIGLLILAPFFIPKLLKTKITKREIGLVSVIALLSGVLGTLLFTTALVQVNYISLSVVFLILYLEPIFAITGARLILKEKLTPKFARWAIVALVAAYFATFRNGLINLNTGAGTVMAALYALGATASWGTSTVFSKMLLNRINETVATGLRFIVTTVLAFAGVLLFAQSQSLLQPTPSQIGRFVFIALSTGMLALFIYYKGLQKTEAKVTTMLELVFPILAVFIDAVVYRTLLAPSQYFAAGVMVFAIYQIAKQGKKKAS
jgi:drug/metabolite transporter (DMT)-like permease